MSCWASAPGQSSAATIATRDTGFKNENLKTIGLALKPNTSAVAVITSHDFLKAMQQQVPVEDIRTVVSNLAAEISAQLAANKNVAIGLLLTEVGLAIKEIAADETSTQVVGAVITGDAVVVGAAVATTDGFAFEAVAATADGEVGEAGTVKDEGAVEGAVSVDADDAAPPAAA